MTGKHRKKLGRPSKNDKAVAAATATVPPWLRDSQVDVLAVLRALGPMTDRSILAFYTDSAGKPRRSPSGLRTRRCELVDLDLVFDSGERDTAPSGRKEIIWAAA